MLPQHVDVNVPERLQGRLGQLLKDFEVFAQRRGFVTKRVEKESGGHLTPFWVYVRLDERAPSRSLVQFGETRHDEVNAVPHLWTRAKEAYRCKALSLLRAFVANAEMAALPPPPQRPVPVPYKTCVAAFDPAEYGAEYLTLSEHDFVEEIEAPTAPEGWAFGRIVYADGGHSEPGWYLPAFAQ